MPEYRVYANREYVANHASTINELCLAVWSTETYEARLKKYGSRARCFAAAESPEEADIWVLPLYWNYYVSQGLTGFAKMDAELAMQAGHRLVVFSQGDLTAHLPFPNAILFEACAYASRREEDGTRIHALPVFVSNYLRKYCDDRIQFREKGRKPVVGFCGQAGGTLLDFARREAVIRLRWLAYQIHRDPWEPTPLEPTRLRSRILAQISRNQQVQTNFILRRRYRAGYQDSEKDPYHPTRMEFIHNILDSDYIVCVRGGGNFSARFYEALALGRIPIFVNTNCVLPFDHEIDYRQYCVWVEQDEIPHIGEKILAFHESLTPSRFKDLQAACYELWREYLSKDGFYAHFHEIFA